MGQDCDRNTGLRQEYRIATGIQDCDRNTGLRQEQGGGWAKMLNAAEAIEQADLERSGLEAGRWVDARYAAPTRASAPTSALTSFRRKQSVNEVRDRVGTTSRSARR
jgi:hypothetical protein